MLSMGCDRETACSALGVTVEQLQAAQQANPGFSRRMLKAEGRAEVHRMHVLHLATKDEKNWRAATWWLERRSRQRLDSRKSKSISTVELQKFIEGLADILYKAVTSEEDRERVVRRLSEVAHAIEAELAEEEWFAEGDVTEDEEEAEEEK